MTPSTDPDSDLERRLTRERKARLEAETIAERVTSELFETVGELTRVNEELQSVNASLRDFVAIASHDLRSPLQSVLGFISTLRRRWDRISESQKLEFLAVADLQAQHLARLVDDLLMVSRIEAGGLRAEKEVVELRRAVEEAISVFTERASDFQISLLGEPRVLADPSHVLRILSNILENAIRYGAPPVELAVRVRESLVEIRVSDRGDGIPLDFLPRLFTKFARAETPANREVRGTGLGLSIVKGLVEANSGEVWYEPNVPRGSCFVLQLPAA